jgi:putative aldouronate transport system substrate-binding protein
MNKFLKVLLTIMLITTFLTACSGISKESENTTTTISQTKSESTTSEQESTEAPKEEIIELTAWIPSSTHSGAANIRQMDTKIGALIAEHTRVTFNCNYITGDPEQAFILKLASGDMEDVIFITSNNWTWVDKLLKSNLIIPIDKYFKMPDKFPNLAEIPDKVINNYTHTDGHIYMFPRMWYEDENSIYGYWLAPGWYVHPDYLNAVGMIADDLKTIDGIENYLKAVKDKNLKNSDGASIIPMSAGQDLSSIWTTILPTFGVSTAYSGFDIYENTIIHFREHPKTKEALAWINRLNNQKLLDVEYVTQKNQQLQEKVMNSRVALFADSALNIWPSVTAGENAATKLEYMNYPSVTGVEKLGISTTYNPYGTGGLAITTSCKNPDAVAKVSDWGSRTGEYIQWQIMYGPRGETWDWDPERGEPWLKVTDEEINKVMSASDYNGLEKLGFQHISNTVMCPFGLDLNYFTPAYEKILAWVFGMHKFNYEQGYHCPIRNFDNIIMPSDSLWNTNAETLRSIDMEYFAKLISAKDEQAFEKVWQEYKAQLESRGAWSKVKGEWESEYLKQVK